MSSFFIEKMPFHLFSFIIPFILFTICLYKWLVVVLHRKPNLPPNPQRLPIIGNLHQIGKIPHRSLRSLSQKYGDYMLLYFGNKPTLVVTSATAAETIMKTHDVIFASRPKTFTVKKVVYGGNNVVFNSYGEKWRQMKSICMTKLLNSKRIQSFRPIREEEAGILIEEIKSYNGSVINLSYTLFMHFKGLICRTALGRKYDKGGDDFYNLFKQLSEVLVEASIGDYIPFLSWIDKLSGLESRAENLRQKLDAFVDKLIKQHLDAAQILIDGESEEKDGVEDFVDVLLEIQRENPEELTIENIKALILDMFVAGSETISTTLEWAMTELIRHPWILKKAQDEVRSKVKANTRVCDEDLETLTYLKAVIKESFRLHPPLPLLVFRESTQNVNIDNYDISEKTQVIINAWAIQLDPKSWDNPENFNPERFLQNSSSVDFKGQHFQFMPFGAGRRGCPGIAYANANVELVLASLVYEFDWKLPNGREGATLDTEENSGLAVGRRNPLLVIAHPTTPFSSINA